MIYQSNHQNPTMSSTRKTSPRPQHRKLQSTASKSSTSSSKGNNKRESEKPIERCRGRCRVQWSEKHVKEGLVLVQEAQLARVVKTGPISEHYEIDPKPFASGQWARVYRCRSRSTGTLYAAKYSSRNRFNTDCSAELRHEIALLSLCSQSPRVVRLHDVYETPKEIILVMEFAPGGDLQTLIDGDLVPLEGDVVHFVKQLVEGLAYLHERNIAHLDIKPQNLVMMGSFPESEVKLCDFEISRVILEGTEVREILGTPDYVAPEILHYEPITLAADMWSLGVTTYVLLTGFSPFGGETDQETFQNISLGEVDFPEELFEDVSTQAKDFVAKLLVLDPSARMSAKQCLRHDWLRDAPTQASPHLRRYLSKSREVLLERVVSRENLRRAALLSQATSHANLTETNDNNDALGGSLSQSEMCLSYGLTDSRASLEGSDYCYTSPAYSRTSLGSSQNSLATSQASLATSQNYFLNKEQTQGLLNQAQSRSQANINHVTRRGLLSRMRSLNQIQSQACLSQIGKATMQKNDVMMNNSLCGSRSQEKLYGLRCLSKSQGVLDIYRSLECLRNNKRRRNERRNVAEDTVPIFKKIGNDIGTSISRASLERLENTGETNEIRAVCSEISGKSEKCTKNVMATLESIRTVESCEETSSEQQERESLKKQYFPEIDVTASEIERLKREKNQNDLSSGQETIVSSDKDFRELPEIKVPNSQKDETEENFDSLQSIESDTLTDDSDEMQTDPNHLTVKQQSKRQNSDTSSHSNNSVNSDDKDEHTESENDEPKYSVAQLVSAFNKHQEVASKTSLEAIMTEKRVNEVTFPTGPKALRLFVPDINITERGLARRKTSYKPRKNWEELRKQNEKNEGVLKDFNNDSGNEDNDVNSYVTETTATATATTTTTTTTDCTSRNNDNYEESLKDGCTVESAYCNVDVTNSVWPICDDTNILKDIETRDCLDTRIDEKYKQCVDGAKSSSHDDVFGNNETAIDGNMTKTNNRSYRREERLPNYIFAEIKTPRNEENCLVSLTNERLSCTTRKMNIRTDQRTSDSSVNLKDILQKIDASQKRSKENLEKLRKRTSITKIIINDNMTTDNDTNNNSNGNNNSSLASVSNRAKSEPPTSSLNEQVKLNITPSFVRSSSLSSDSGSCPTPSSVQSDIGLSWENVEANKGSSASLENNDVDKRLAKRTATVWTDLSRGDSQKIAHAESRIDSGPRARAMLPMTPEERRVWGKVCTGSYTRAMEKFNGKRSNEAVRKISMNIPRTGDCTEKTRRKSSPAMPQYGES